MFVYSLIGRCPSSTHASGGRYGLYISMDSHLVSVAMPIRNGSIIHAALRFVLIHTDNADAREDAKCPSMHADAVSRIPNALVPEFHISSISSSQI